MRLHVGAVEGGRFRDRSEHRQSLDQIGPKAPPGLAIEPVVDRRGGTTLGQAITPSEPCLKDMYDAWNHAPIIDTLCARLVSQDVPFNKRTPRIAQPKQACNSPASNSLKPLGS